MPIPSADFEPAPFHARRPGLWRPVTVDPGGVTGPTRAQTKGKGWRRTGPGLYLPRRFEATSTWQRLVEVGTGLPAGAAITGWAALDWLGARWRGTQPGDGLDRQIPLLARNHRLSDRPGCFVTAESFRPREIYEVDGLSVTSPFRSACFEARYASDLVEAVRWLDLAASSDLASLDELATYSRTLGTWTGVPQLREALRLANENVWSPAETAMRLLWVTELGWTQVVANQPVFDLDGRFVATPDLLDPTSGVAGEYDGSLHLEGRQRAKDIRREGDLRRLGLEYVTMTAADLRDSSQFLQRSIDARQRAARSSGSPRRWTIEPPSWWTPTTTVAQRRALSAEQRRRFLRRAG